MARKGTINLFLGCDKSTGVLQVIIFLIIISFPVSQSAAQGITIEGSVILESVQKAAISTTTGGYQNVPSGSSFSDKEPSSNNIVLWLEAKNQGAIGGKDRNTDKAVLDQVDKNFKPRLMIIRSGDVVRIRNSDPVYHNVFSLSKTKRFDVGRRSPDDYQDVQFDKPGKVDVFCDIHSDMHAVIIVAPKQTVAIKKLKTEGEFTFENIPEGQYTLHLYALGDRSRQINIEVTNQEKVTLQAIRLGS